ncbi:WD40-repeat-containing domain protein [Cokeromyces recurvatus]|uniref:WD40-repeat-containing domain protein n=1 Tax=Cokeromyces recurvatus TaxID=90255 RepID=UPI00222092C5|nr:WD40-repeat-containing domain protein [Cokeromyces recurvatus]KAI7905290.1 WD40-repeat-containing domain protein [Cokeromyces recurvatus]
MAALSEYERKRLENIKANEELLRSLEIPVLATTKRKATSSPSNSSIKKHTPKQIKKEPRMPTRSSARLRGKSPEKQIESDIVSLETKQPKTIDALNEIDKKKLVDIMKDALRDVPNTQVKKDRIKTEKGEQSDQILKSQLEHLKIQHEWATVKVTPNRITADLFHPSVAKLLACAVDTEGYLGIWDVNAKEEETEDPVVYQYKPHTRNITDLHFNPSDNSKLLTSSYDGLLRVYDMNKAEFMTMNLGGETYPITCFDITQTGNIIWFSTSDGEVGVVDSRTGDTPLIHAPKEKKIGCLHLNPVDQNLLALASNDRTTTIWDIRMWNKRKREVGEPLQSIEHGYSVTSAYWSPNGDILATASYDDYIRLFDLNKNNKTVELKSAIKHNNHTGRWVTNFRARWNTNQVNGLDVQHLIIGNMNQTVDIYSGETGEEIIQFYDSEHITAIPSVCQFHPMTSNPIILTGNASGRMVCWS